MASPQQEDGYPKITNKMAEEKDLERKILERIRVFTVFNDSLEFYPEEQSALHRMAFCPFPHKGPIRINKIPTLSVNSKTWTWKCFHCGLGGDVFDFYMRRYHISNRGKAIRRIAWEWGMDTKAKKGKR